MREFRKSFEHWRRRAKFNRHRLLVRLRASAALPAARHREQGGLSRLIGFTTERLEEALAEACHALDLVLVGQPQRSHWQKSIGAKVCDPGGTLYWLKVSGAFNKNIALWFREGEETSGAVNGVPKPALLKIHDWTMGDVAWRAALMTLAPSSPFAPAMDFGHGVETVTDEWIGELKSAVDVIGRIDAPRFRMSPEYVAAIITNRFGKSAPHVADEWRTAHGDLNWSHLTAPELSLLDWEMWGSAPRGFDAACLISFSCANPKLVARLSAAFADDLNTPSGRVAQLAHCSDMLVLVEAGWLDPKFHRPLEDIALARLRPG